MTAAALIPLAIALLPMIQTGVKEFIAWIQSLKAAAEQAGEWTPELNAMYRAGLWAKTQDPAYQPDP